MNIYLYYYMIYNEDNRKILNKFFVNVRFNSYKIFNQRRIFEENRLSSLYGYNIKLHCHYITVHKDQNYEWNPDQIRLFIRDEQNQAT